MAPGPLNRYLICSTGLGPTQRQELAAAIQECGGRYTGDYTEDVNVLIAEKTGSDKYKLAVRVSKPIVRPEWVYTHRHALAEEVTPSSAHLDPEVTLKRFLLPPFAGCRVHLTGFPSTTLRSEIQGLITHHGGLYDRSATPRCTHLVAQAARGEKYRLAQGWGGTHIVNMDWVHDSVKMGACADESLYPVPVAHSSTGSKLQRAATAPEGPNSPPRRPLCRAASDGRMGETDPPKGPAEDNSTAVTARSPTPTFTPTPEPQPVTGTHLHIPIKLEGGSAPHYLAGCFIYLGYGFSPTKLLHLKKIIDEGGGVRLNRFPAASITHFVTFSSQLSAKDRILLTSHLSSGFHIVNQRWLRDCYHQRTQLPITPYLISFPRTVEPPNEFAMEVDLLARRETGANPDTPTPLSRRLASISTLSGKTNLMTASAENINTPSYLSPSNPVPGVLESKPPNTIRRAKSSCHDFTSEFTKNGPPDSPYIRRVGPQIAGEVHPLLSRTMATPCTGSVPLPALLPDPLREQSPKAIQSANNETPALLAHVLFITLYFSSQQLAVLHRVITQHGGRIWESALTNSDLDLLLSDQSAAVLDQLRSMPFPSGTRESSPSKVVYIITPLGGSSADAVPQPHRFKALLTRTRHTPVLADGRSTLHIVTECWLEKCLEDHIVYDEYSAIHYRPLEVPRPLSALSSCLISISGFEGLERGHLLKLLNTLGVACNVKFSRRHTHLVALHASGAKYTKALEWGIPVHGADWVYQLARPVEQSPPDEPSVELHPEINPSKPASPPISHLLTPAGQPAPVTPVHLNFYETFTPSTAGRTADPSSSTTPAVSVAEPLTPTPAISLALSASHTPLGTPMHPVLGGHTRDARFSLDSPSGLQFDITDALLDLKTPTREIMARVTGQPLLSASLHSPHYQHSGDSAWSAFSATDSNTPPSPESILRGAVLYISTRINHRRSELTDLARRMGAHVVWSLNDSCTHYIHQGNRVQETFKEFKQARGMHKLIVSPWWLYRCLEEGRRLSVSGFPHTFNPCLLLNLQPALPNAADEPNARPSTPIVTAAVPPTPTPPPAAVSHPPTMPQTPSIIVQSASPATPEASLPPPPPTHPVPAVPVKDYASEIETLLGKMPTLRDPKISLKRRYRGPEELKVTATTTSTTTTTTTMAPATVVEAKSPVWTEVATTPTTTAPQPSARPDSGNSLAQSTPVPPAPGAETGGMSPALFLMTQEQLTVQYQDPEAQRERSLLLNRLRDTSHHRSNSNASNSSTASEAAASPMPSGTSAGCSTQTPGNHQGTGSQVGIDTHYENPFLESGLSPTSAAALTVPTVPRSGKTLGVPPVAPLPRADSDLSLFETALTSSDLDARILPSSATHLSDGGEAAKPATTTTSDILSTRAANSKSVENDSNLDLLGSEPPPISLRDASLSVNSRSSSPSKQSRNRTAPPAKVRIFQLSSIPPVKRKKIVALLEKLGGRVVDKDGFDPTCTHLIAGYANRSEKLIAAISMGLWVLQPSYLEESAKQGKFLDETPYEWSQNHNIPPDEANLAFAAQQWREHLTKSSRTTHSVRGAFVAWRVLLCASDRKLDCYTRIIQAGGAQVVACKISEQREKLRTLATQVFTHLIVDKDVVNQLRRDMLDILVVEQQCLCVTTEFIHNFLTVDHDQHGVPTGLPPWICNRPSSKGKNKGRMDPAVGELKAIGQTMIDLPLVQTTYLALMSKVLNPKVSDMAQLTTPQSTKRKMSPSPRPGDTSSTPSLSPSVSETPRLTRTTTSRPGKTMSLSAVKRKRTKQT
ncbi:hypothetical protein BJ085DRAFT_39125 [Dimargaris cristalligena]|uniref:BRCT domain-containing protein n=1 Tax=Dimargaris cristalligena TaxID=215637 RepID=A0A4P9ZRY6_9FUNG|nr:hypothetical protein BJ085DRAFT_39125 [Dimargaris cristalligena]|eukprot:RKP36177.1 hypothetical protein BJ085DRAFT_39125 [Dimargaris cristalligena]